MTKSCFRIEKIYIESFVDYLSLSRNNDHEYVLVGNWRDGFAKRVYKAKMETIHIYIEKSHRRNRTARLSFTQQLKQPGRNQIILG